MLKINLSLKNSTPKSIKYFLLNILLKVTNSFCRRDHNLHGIYEAIHALNYFNEFKFFTKITVSFFKFSGVYQQHKSSQGISKILRAIPLVLALLSRNCPLRKPIKQLFLSFLSLFFFLCPLFHKDSVKSLKI